MSIGQSFLAEYDQEMASTRKVLERVPDDKLEWKAHPKSNTIAWVGSHLVEIPSWIPGSFADTVWDIAPVGGEPYRTPKLGSRQEMLDKFDKNVAEGRATLESATDEAFMTNWSLHSGGQAVLTMPRIALVRGFVLNHSIHHRACLCVYLRLNDIPVPGMYGPSGDD